MQARGEKTRVDKYHKKWQGLRAVISLSIRGKGREERGGKGKTYNWAGLYNNMYCKNKQFARNRESRRQVTVMQVVQSLASGTTSMSSSIFEV
jgi:hypothetical protein